MKIESLKTFDAAEHLTTSEAITTFLTDASESNDQRVYQEALNIAARARQRIRDKERHQP